MKRIASYKNTLKFKVGILIFFAVILQSLFVLFAVGIANIPGIMENFSYSLFTGTVNNRKNYLTSEMLNRWSNIEEFNEVILESYDTAILSSYTGNQFNITFFDEAVPGLISMMKETSSTGGFIIIDDAASSDVSNSAIYISNSNYASSIDENSVLQMVVGPSEISKKYSISLANSWSYGLKLEEANKEILQKPLEAVEITDDDSFWGYWAVTPQIANPQNRMLTYSIPLIDRNGDAFGVMGIEISQDYIYKFLPFGEFSDEGSYGYTLVSKDAQTGAIIPLMTQGTAQKSILEVDAPLVLEDMNMQLYNEYYSPQVIVSDIVDVAIHCEMMEIYAPNTPFEDESIYLLGMTSVENITGFADDVVSLFSYLFVASLIFAVVIACLIGDRFSKPITNLSKAVAKHESGQLVIFDKTKISEIDELSTAIVDLNKNILNSAYKTDNVLDMLNIKVGSFEHTDNSDRVIISGQLRRLMGLPLTDVFDTTVEKELFDQRFKKLKAIPEEDMESTYLVSQLPERWFRITEMRRKDTNLGVIMDVTKEVLETKKLNYQRDYDMLTGIYNRAAFHRKARAILDREDLKVAAFVMFDLDNLKYVNDTFGHNMGDNYIKSAATVLSTTLSKSALVGRMSGDEFYVFIYGYDSKQQIHSALSGVYREFEENPIILPDAGEFKIRMSGGISWYGDDSTDLEDLIRFADFAMYEGKHTLKGELREFNKEAYSAESFMLSGKEELNRILDNQFIDFVFQPIIDAKTASIYAYESLMRPQSEILNTPLKLLQISTAQSQLWKVEKITFFKTLSLYTKYRDMFADAKMFINSVPNKALREAEFIEFERLYGKHLSNIVVEIIETEQMDAKSLEYKLDRIKSWNAMVALDDYGAGYNNDLGLLSLHPNIVKLDRTLITNVESDQTRQGIVGKIISFCKEQGIYVLAEGVETYAQMEYLTRIGIDYLQGYYISRPLPQPNFDNTKIKGELDAINHNQI